MRQKARVFIGSSSESLGQANAVKKMLAEEFDVLMWTDGIFQSNESPLSTLLTEAGLFDFGIMVLSKDDYTISRRKWFDAPRDNTLFEFGIFLGRLSDNCAFALAEEGVKLPSDLYGSTIEEYVKGVPADDYHSLEAGVGKIAARMHEMLEVGHLGLLPSTALAIGYFNNFVKEVAESIAGRVSIDGGAILSLLNVVIPEELDADIKNRARVFCGNLKLEQVQLETKGRHRHVFVASGNRKGDVVAYDLPTALEGINKAIDLYLRRGCVGKTNRHKLLELRELNNFTHVLSLLVDSDSYARKYVRIGFERDFEGCDYGR